MTKEQKEVYKWDIECKINKITKELTNELKERKFGHHVAIKHLTDDYFRWTEELETLRDELGENEIPF